MSSSSGATEAQIRNEIERLTATINQHKAAQIQKTWNLSSHYSPYPTGAPKRSSTYVNPNYKPANKYIRPGLNVAGPSKEVAITGVPTTVAPPVAPPISNAPITQPQSIEQKKEVVLNGVAFESSRRSLVRKNLPKPISAPNPPITHSSQSKYYGRKPGHIPPSKTFKLNARRGRNMTLNNTRRSYPSSRKSLNKRPNKYVDKPCPRFTTTGACSRGLTCPYQHNPTKIAICWNFLQGNCSKTAETCNLSHEPTPERTPLCVHFMNKGRCTRQNCPYPHINVGVRKGVCRDFAVLGYCERGLECDQQHIRECPDFAENGTCGSKGCKLPHVIRANRNRKLSVPVPPVTEPMLAADEVVAKDRDDTMMLTAEDGQLGDEYISLTFKESDSEGEEEGEEEEESGDDEEQKFETEASDSEMADIEVNM